MTANASAHHRGGLPYALGAYFIWGLMPLYIVLLQAVDPFRLVAWRILWTIPICAVALVAMRGFGKVRRALADKRTMLFLSVSSLLISANWVVYVLAVQAGQFYAASLGYYINPLMNILLGTAFLHERLSRLQWLAVAVAAVGIGILAFEAAATLFISVAIGSTFAVYGLVRKLVSVESLPGLTVEVLLLTLPSTAALALLPPGTKDFGDGWTTSLILAGAGVMTGVPLLLFAAAARRMTYSALGFVQFLAPTMVFIFGLLVFGEELVTTQAICFALIWTAVALFCWDILSRRPRRAKPPARA